MTLVLQRLLDDLVDAGMSIDIRDEDGCTAMMRLLGTPISSRLVGAAVPIREALCTTLLNRKANPRLKDNHGRTALHHLASTRGCLPEGKAYADIEENIINKLKAKKADFNAGDDLGITPLMTVISVDNGCETDLQHQRVLALLKNGAQVDKADLTQRTALMYGALGFKVCYEDGSNEATLTRNQTYFQYLCVAALIDAGASLRKKAVVDGLEFPWIKEIDNVEMVRQLRMNKDDLEKCWQNCERHRHHADQVEPCNSSASR